MLDSIQNFSRLKAIIFAGLILGLFLLLSYGVNIPAAGKEKLEALLADAGFGTPKIGSISYSMGGLQARDITLDAHGFDKIQQVDVRFSWPAFLTVGKVNDVKITGLSLSRRGNALRSLLQSPLQKLTKMSEYRLALENTVIDLSTSVGDLRFILNAFIDPPADKTGQQKITASIAADQYQLGFNSKWAGTLAQDGTLAMSADLLDGRLHFGPLEITRFGGWITLDAGAQKFALQSQIDAGGAALFKVPMQDISLVTDVSGTASTVMFRSSMAGLTDVALTGDWASGEGKQSLDITLKGENMARFFERIAADRKDDNTVPSVLKRNEPFRIQASYLADRRFAGGPLPFSLEGLSDGEKILFGNFLIYPEELDIRGSAEIDPALAKGVASFFDINADHIDRNFIRLDGDLADLLGVPKPAARTGAQEPQQ